MGTTSTPRSLILPVLIGGMLVLTAGFGWSTWQSHREFRTYRDATLADKQHPPRWAREAVTPEGCVEESIAWASGCPGVQSWCEAATPEVVSLCLKSQQREEYCRELGDEVLSTRLGFAACKALYEPIEDKYARRRAKKACAMGYRVIARLCRPDATVHLEWEDDASDKMARPPGQPDESSDRKPRVGA